MNGFAMCDIPQGHAPRYLRFTGIAKCLLILMIAGLALNTGIKVWSLVTPPASSVVLSGTTATASWQFIDEFPSDLVKELHFILDNSGSTPEPPFDRDTPAQARSVVAAGGSTECLVDARSVSLAGRLARFDDTGKIVAFGLSTSLTFRELIAGAELNGGSVISDEVERTVIFASKNETRWKCVFIDGDSKDSFLLCETVEDVRGHHKNE